MTDRIVASGWWILVMGIVTASAIAAVLLWYAGLLELIARDWTRGGASILAGIITATICALLCRHRGDLLA